MEVDLHHYLLHCLTGQRCANPLCIRFCGNPIAIVPLPPVLNLQLDNASGDNKNHYVFAFCSL